jgi:prepilin-type N-terminal cleavage/methylation domain-containing protein
MRARGFTLVEVMVAVSLTSILLLAAFSLLGTSQSMYGQGSIENLTRVQAQKVLDAMSADLRCAAAWRLWKVDAGLTGAPAPVELTKFWASNKRTRGTSTNQSMFDSAATGQPFDASTTAIAFLKVVNANFIAGTTGTGGTGSYLILDFEPKEPAPLAADANTPGTTLTDNQPGRMDDDPTRYYICYRTRVVRNRVVVECVRGLKTLITDDGTTVGLSATANQQTIYQVGDLGPATGISPTGFLTVSLVDPYGSPGLGANTGAGEVEIHVVAKGRVINGSKLSVITADVSTRVALPCATPPY